MMSPAYVIAEALRKHSPTATWARTFSKPVLDVYLRVAEKVIEALETRGYKITKDGS